MRYITCAEIAEHLGCTVRRVQQMCREGMISGAVKKGKTWMIPANAVSAVDEQTRPLPIGVADFKEASKHYYYVDKTLMLREFLDRRPKVSLFTRPRRFGKTLNMDMFRVFFERCEEDTSIYFQDKLIWECGERYRQYQGKYPVIFLSFKDVKYDTWEETRTQICRLISRECLRHIELEESPKLNQYEKKKFLALANEEADSLDYQMSLQILSLLLHKHYGVETVIILDEYDIPIQQGYLHGYYREIIGFMRNFFSGGLKDNRHLAFGFLTGILRVAKESIFSGLNNIKIDSVLDTAYSQFFGFTKAEVEQMLKYYNAGDKIEEVCEWYDGYLFGDTEIFNPWSVINYIGEQCIPKAFWQATGSNDIIGEIIGAADADTAENLYKLLQGESIISYIDTNVVYPEVQSHASSIYSFLLMSGYLRVVEKFPQFDGNYICAVSVPNKEISFVYAKEVLGRIRQTEASILMKEAIFSGNVDRLQCALQEFMLNSVSSMDGSSESFYHGMMLGLCAMLGNQYQIKSNRESGMGRFDIMLIPRMKTLPAFIFEFKYTKDVNADLGSLAEKAFRQIEDKKYDTELQDVHVSSIRKIGIAFRGKEARVRGE